MTIQFTWQYPILHSNCISNISAENVSLKYTRFRYLLQQQSDRWMTMISVSMIVFDSFAWKVMVFENSYNQSNISRTYESQPHAFDRVFINPLPYYNATVFSSFYNCTTGFCSGGGITTSVSILCWPIMTPLVLGDLDSCTPVFPVSEKS